MIKKAKTMTASWIENGLMKQKCDRQHLKTLMCHAVTDDRNDFPL